MEVNSTPKPLRAHSYARTSVVLRQNPSLQHVAIKEYADKNNIKIINEFTDEISGSTSKRPALDLMLASVKRKEVDFIIIGALDRLGRSSSHLIGLIPLLKANNCGLISLRESLNLDNPAGRAFFGILSILCELDRETISERIRVALRSRRILCEQAGKEFAIGRPKSVTPEIIQEVNLLRSQGVSIRNIVKRLNGGVSGQGISKTSVERIIKGRR